MGIEYELKFRADRKQLAAIRQAFVEPEQILQMQTTYYDTPDGTLSQRFYTLRRRQENDRSVCTLKTPEQGLGRREFEVEGDRIQEAIPELCKLAGPTDLLQLAEAGLIPVCEARFTRIAKVLQMDGLTVELALDEGTLSGGNHTQPFCEVEVELKAGPRQAADAFAQYLAHRFCLTPELRSKFRRALDLRGVEK